VLLLPLLSLGLDPPLLFFTSDSPSFFFLLLSFTLSFLQVVFRFSSPRANYIVNDCYLHFPFHSLSFFLFSPTETNRSPGKDLNIQKCPFQVMIASVRDKGEAEVQFLEVVEQ
jgi:hypothetical protein